MSSAAVSIVVPVHGRAQLTRRCLDALLGGLDDRCEVIVVDDASTDATPALLASYGEAIRTLTLERNAGYAHACNAGAALATHGLLLFLNNDTEPRAGWLEAMRGCMQEHPAAEVVGAKLLYPTGAVQHAGVAIGQDGFPHNLYAGLPSEHPAVNRSRALQAVTGACMLVRRAAFERLGGFDEGYLNSLEDVDLCLRVGARGGEVRYCPEAVLVHLESASRGRRERFARSVEHYRERWRGRVRRDDLEIYAEDGLLEVEYPDSYPVRLTVSPRLAVVDDGRDSEIELLLEAYAGHVADLLAEIVRLTAITGAEPSLGEARAERGARFDRHRFLEDVARLQEQVRALQERLERADAADGFTAAGGLGYPELVRRIRDAVAQGVPEGRSVLVVSRGDRALLDLCERTALHFPQDARGRYLGHHPHDSEEAIARLERLREAGAEYLVLPSTAYWWLDHYVGFAEHLRERYPVSDFGACAIYELQETAR
jgi:GT2 family glycosyltransferase